VLTGADAIVEKYKVGDLIEGYRVLKELGTGAASIVYLAQDPKTKQIWAIKHVEKTDPKGQRFLDQAESEYRIASEFDHPAIRKIDRLIKKGSLLSTRELFLVMEFVDGTSEERVAPRQVEQVVDVVHQVARGMAHMHERGYVHADMKPNNIMVDGGAAKIIDLGQSCKTGTVKERIQGTPDYIAPEQVHRRAITPKTDIFNLGATTYWMLTRKNIPTALPREEGSLVSSLDDNMIERPTPPIELNPRVPQRLSDLVMKAVEVDPDNRPSSMHELADQLQLILGIVRAQTTRNGAARKDNANTGSKAGAPAIDPGAK
jgi:serine/threonine-protein kinase